MKHFIVGAALAVASLTATAAQASTISLEATGTVSDVSFFSIFPLETPLAPDPVIAAGADVQLSVMYDLNSPTQTFFFSSESFFIAQYRVDVLATVTFSNENGSASFDYDTESSIRIDERFGRVSSGFNDLDAPASAFGNDDGRAGLSFAFVGTDPTSLSIVPDFETFQAAVMAEIASTSPPAFQFTVTEVDADGNTTGLEAAFATLDLSTITVAEVPLPAAGWMLIAGLGGLAALRRRQRAS